jgi:hypothetical protein
MPESCIKWSIINHLLAAAWCWMDGTYGAVSLNYDLIDSRFHVVQYCMDDSLSMNYYFVPQVRRKILHYRDNKTTQIIEILLCISLLYLACLHCYSINCKSTSRATLLVLSPPLIAQTPLWLESLFVRKFTRSLNAQILNIKKLCYAGT